MDNPIEHFQHGYATTRRAVEQAERAAGVGDESPMEREEYSPEQEERSPLDTLPETFNALDVWREKFGDNQ